MANAIIYLMNNTEEDIRDFRISYLSIEKNLLPFIKNTDIILLYEHDEIRNIFDDILKYERIIWQKITFKLPDYSQEILSQIPEFYPHPTHGNGPVAYGHPGFNMGYRFMCRLFSHPIFEIAKEYEYYMRLDTDSFILSPINYDPFEWAKNNNVYYSYIEPAVQFDHPDVSYGLNEFIKNKINEFNISTLRNINTLEQGKLYYTNFELCKVDWFINNKNWNWFFKMIDESGMIFMRRWGDHIIRYLGINLFMNPENIIPIKNFHYQHGAEYKV
jgi:hypothetical protein